MSACPNDGRSIAVQPELNMLLARESIIIVILYTILPAWRVCGQCTDPGTPVGGHRDGSIQSGDTIRFWCAVGYALNVGGSSYTIHCNAGNWNGTAPLCELITCPEPVDIANSDKDVVNSGGGSSYLYHSTVTYSCHTGFRFHDGAVQKTGLCTSASTWDPIPSACSEVQCGSLPDVTHSVTPTGDYYYGQTAAYTCENGYSKTSGSDVMTCSATGNWNGDYIVCDIVDCGDPGTPLNADRDFLSGTRYNDIVQYSCNDKYYPHPENEYPSVPPYERQCTATGEWTKSPLQCLGKPCHDLPPVPNSQHPAGPWRSPESVSFTCDTGYEVVIRPGQAIVLQCQDLDPVDDYGTWDYESITCERVECSDSVDKINGTVVTTQEFVFDDTKTYTCLEGYKLASGNRTRTCQANGQFSGDPPNCERVGCPDPGPLYQDHASATESDFLFQSTITYTCHVGYIMVVNGETQVELSVTCAPDGLWYPPPTLCIPTYCGPPDGEGLNYTGTTFQYLEVLPLQLWCSPEDELLPGDMTRTCQANGQWSGDPPDCQPKSCGPPTSVTFTIIVGSSYELGDSVVYVAEFSYEIQSGDAVHVCEPSGWIGNLPILRLVTCPPPTAMAHGWYNPLGNHRRDYGSVVTYSCGIGFDIVGTALLTCEASKAWSGDPPVCEPKYCGPPQDITNTISLGTSYYFKDKVEYSCVENHTGQFSVSTVIKECTESGGWDGPNINCVPITCYQPNLDSMAYLTEPMKDVYSLGDKVQYGCAVDYYIPPTQEKVRYCSFTGTWSPAQPRCEPFPNTTLTGVTKPTPVPAEAEHAEQVGMVGIALVTTQVIVILLLDCFTFAQNCRAFKRNVCFCCRRLAMVAPLKNRRASEQRTEWATRKTGSGLEGKEMEELDVRGLDDTEMALKRIQYTGYTTYTAALLFPEDNRPKRKKILLAS